MLGTRSGPSRSDPTESYGSKVFAKVISRRQNSKPGEKDKHTLSTLLIVYMSAPLVAGIEDLT